MHKMWYNLLGGSTQGGYLMARFRDPVTTKEKARALSFLFGGQTGMHQANMAQWLKDPDFVNELYRRVASGKRLETREIYDLAKSIYDTKKLQKKVLKKLYPDISFGRLHNGLKEMEHYLGIRTTGRDYGIPATITTKATKRQVSVSYNHTDYALAKKVVLASKAASKAAHQSVRKEIEPSLKVLLRAPKGRSLMTHTPSKIATIQVSDSGIIQQSDPGHVVTVNLAKPTEV